MGSATPLTIGVFVAALVLASLTFAGSILLLTRSTVVEAEPRPEPAAIAAVARTAAPASVAVRVTSATGAAERLDSGAYRVTFLWMLEGARDADPVLVRFSAGSRQLSESRGALDPSVYSASTGRLTLVTSQDCSADGWSAELISVRGQTPAGDRVARASGVACR
jgi:hypothetical protein